MPAGPSKQVGSGPVGLRYDIACRCCVAAMLYLGSDFRRLSVSGESGTSFGPCRITSTSAEPISAIGRSTSGFDRLLLRTIAMMDFALVDVIRHGPKRVPDSPDSREASTRLLCFVFAGALSCGLSGVVRAVAGSPQAAMGVSAPPSNAPAC